MPRNGRWHWRSVITPGGAGEGGDALVGERGQGFADRLAEPGRALLKVHEVVLGRAPHVAVRVDMGSDMLGVLAAVAVVASPLVGKLSDALGVGPRRASLDHDAPRSRAVGRVQRP